jgi:sugar/nucleoside kinase (ribokinase family)
LTAVPRVVVVGDVMDDVIARPLGPIATDTDTPSIIERRAGGSAANTACWLAVAGVSATFVGQVGRDDVDRQARLLGYSGLGSVLIGGDKPTGSIVVISEGPVRTMLTSRGANLDLAGDDVGDDLLAGADHLYLTGHAVMDGDDDAQWRDLLDRAARAGVRRWVAPGSVSMLATYGPDRFRTLVRGVEVLLASREEAELLAGESGPDRAAAVLAADHELVVVTLGDEGALARSGDRVVRVPAVPADAVDVTGAGDAFVAGLVAALIDGGDLETALRSASHLAARAVTLVGARPRRA